MQLAESSCAFRGNVAQQKSSYHSLLLGVIPFSPPVHASNGTGPTPSSAATQNIAKATMASITWRSFGDGQGDTGRGSPTDTRDW